MPRRRYLCGLASWRLCVVTLCHLTLLCLYLSRRNTFGGTNMSFTRMDQGKLEDWLAIGQQVTQRQSAMPSIIKAMLLQLEEQLDGFAVNQLQHGLQTATRASRDGAS